MLLSRRWVSSLDYTTFEVAGLTRSPCCTGPRNRAPLGMKTTNAKATGFQTPGLQPDNLKTQKTNRKGSSLKKAKKIEPLIQPSEPQAISKPEEEDVRDVEYAPPNPKGQNYLHMLTYEDVN